MAINSVVIEGNLTRDPVQRETQSGLVVTVFSIAYNYREEVSFFDIEAWEALAVSCFKHLKKGSHVRIAGRMKQDRWETTEGEQASRIKIVAQDVDFKVIV